MFAKCLKPRRLEPEEWEAEGATATEPSNLAGIRKAIRDAAKQRDQDFQDWTEATNPKLQQHLG